MRLEARQAGGVGVLNDSSVPLSIQIGIAMELLLDF
jgi:hypothetical protein